MRTESNQVNLIRIRIKPYQQEITFDMAFHVSLIIAGKHVWIILLWNRLLVC